MNGRMRRSVVTERKKPVLKRKEQTLLRGLKIMRIEFARAGIQKRKIAHVFNSLDISINAGKLPLDEYMHWRLERIIRRCKRGETSEAAYLLGIIDGANFATEAPQNTAR